MLGAGHWELRADTVPDRLQVSGLSHAEVFSRFLRRPDPEVETFQAITRPTNEETTSFHITNLDDSSRHSQSQDVTEVQPEIIDESSRNFIDVKWDRRPEQPESDEIAKPQAAAGITIPNNRDEPEESIQNDPETAICSDDYVDPVTAEPENECEPDPVPTRLQDAMKKYAILVPCHGKRLNCSSKISEEERKGIWTHYWSHY